MKIEDGDMICRCGDEAAQEVDEMVEEVTQRIAGGSEELAKRPIPREELTTAIIASLEWDFRAHITGIFYDQWGGVHAADDKGNHIRVEFDRLDDGLAAIWKWFADRKEEEDERRQAPSAAPQPDAGS